MEIITQYLTHNPCYKQGRSIAVKGLMLHSVGCNQPDPRVFVNNWNREGQKRACVHGFVGGDTVYICLPILEMPGKAMRGWHGGGKSNNTHIGVEMCEPSCIKYIGGSTFTCSDKAAAIRYVQQTTQNAAKLFARLCAFHGLSPLEDGVIVSHAEGYKRGIASNHGDPDHLWRGLGMDYTMDDFRGAVAELLAEEEEVRYRTIDDVPRWGKDILRKLIAAEILKGSGQTEDGEMIIDLSHDMLRTIILAYRGGAYDRKLQAAGILPAVPDHLAKQH